MRFRRPTSAILSLARTVSWRASATCAWCVATGYELGDDLYPDPEELEEACMVVART